MSTSFKYHIFMVIMGLSMGAIMVLTGFTQFEQVHKMFVFEDFRLLFGFAGAVMISVIGFYLMTGFAKKSSKKISKSHIHGGMMFGAGWAITGACPTIALAQLGQGQLASVFSIFGILFGVWIYRQMGASTIKLDAEICGDE